MTTLGRLAEQEFEERYKRLGKRAFVHRITDAAEVHGMNGKPVTVKPQPADYLVVENGNMFLAEVKSVESALSFRSTMIRKGQWAAANRTIRAGGLYFFFIYSKVRDKWFKVPAIVIIDADKGTFKWSDLAPYEWSLA